jgi:hypothetical protein
MIKMEPSNYASSATWLMPEIVVSAYVPPRLRTGDEKVLPAAPGGEAPSRGTRDFVASADSQERPTSG